MKLLNLMKNLTKQKTSELDTSFKDLGCEIDSLISSYKQLEEEVMEQCRINARGQERELMLQAENEELKRQLQIKQYQVDIADESYSIVINERLKK